MNPTKTMAVLAAFLLVFGSLAGSVAALQLTNTQIHKLTPESSGSAVVELTIKGLTLHIGESIIVTGKPGTPLAGQPLILKLDGVAKIGEPGKYLATFSLWKKGSNQKIATGQFTEGSQIQKIKEKITLDKITETTSGESSFYTVELTVEGLTLHNGESTTVTGQPETPWAGQPLTLKFDEVTKVGAQYVATFTLLEKDGDQIATSRFTEHSLLQFRYQGYSIVAEDVYLEKITLENKIRLLENRLVSAKTVPGFQIQPDLTGDGTVDLSDLAFLVSKTGNSATTNESMKADLSHDKKIDGKDLEILLGFYGQTVRKAVWVNPDLDGNGVVDQADLALLLSSMGSKNKGFDLSHDGTVDEKDVRILRGFYGQKV